MALFVDLQFVAMMSKLAHSLSGCNPVLSLTQFNVIGQCFSIFNIFFVLRQDFDEYMTRFSAQDWLTVVVYFLYQYALLIMVMNSDINDLILPKKFVPDGVVYCTGPKGSKPLLDDDGCVEASIFTVKGAYCVIEPTIFRNFSYGFFGSRVLLVLFYIVVFHRDKSGHALHQFLGKTIIFTCSACLLFAGAMLTKDSTKLSYLLITVSAMEMGSVLLLSMLSSFNLPFNSTHYPFNFQQLYVRLGSFILLVFGESIIIMLNVSVVGNPPFHYFVNCGGLLLLYGTAQQYFNRLMDFPGEKYLKSRNHVLVLLFIYGHSVLGFSIFIIAQGIVQIATQGGDPVAMNLARGFLSYGCFCTAVILEVLNFFISETQEKVFTTWSLVNLSVHAGLAIIHLCFNYVPNNFLPGSYVFFHGTVAFITAMFEVVMAHYEPEVESAVVPEQHASFPYDTRSLNRDKTAQRPSIFAGFVQKQRKSILDLFQSKK